MSDYSKDSEALAFLQACDAIVANALEGKKSIDSLAKVAMDKFVFYEEGVFLEKLEAVSPICGVPEPKRFIAFILGKNNVKRDKDTGKYILVHPKSAKAHLSEWRHDERSLEFSQTQVLIDEYNDEAKAAKSSTKESALDMYSKKIKKYLKKLKKEAQLLDWGIPDNKLAYHIVDDLISHLESFDKSLYTDEDGIVINTD